MHDSQTKQHKSALPMDEGLAVEALSFLKSQAHKYASSYESEDLASETLLRALCDPTWAHARTASKRKAWLRRILAGIRTDHLRRKRIDSAEPELSNAPARLRADGLSALEELAESDAILILLRDILRCGGETLALAVGLRSSESALRAHRRALQRLGGRIQDSRR